MLKLTDEVVRLQASVWSQVRVSLFISWLKMLGLMSGAGFFFKLQYNPLKLSSTQTYLKSTCVYSIVDNISKYLLCAKNIFNIHVKQWTSHAIHLCTYIVLFKKDKCVIAFEYPHPCPSLTQSPQTSCLRSFLLCLASPWAPCFEVHLY